jgi:hypothetical protein
MKLGFRKHRFCNGAFLFPLIASVKASVIHVL